jgi:MFS family permease
MPILSAVLFMTSPIPNMETQPPAAISGNRKHLWGMVLCVGCIFFGSCAENTMSNWVSGFVETALGVDKALGDVLGMAMFAILLGIARISYAKFGKKIMPILMGGMIGAAACYLLVGLSSHPAVVLVACMLTGLFTSMLWPGTLILMEEKIPNVGVTAYALMAASGDMGASVAPQLMGVVTDTVAASPLAASLSQTLNLSTEQIGMKAGMLVSAVFPILGVVLLLIAIRYFKKKEQA